MALAILTAGGAGAADPAPVGAMVQPHRAVYVMTLGQVRSGGNISDVKGAMVAEWAKSCAGWTTKQRVKLEIFNSEGEPLVTDSNSSSFESMDGLTYRFTTRTTRNGRVTEDYQGNASLKQTGGEGIATFTQPEGLRFDLPKGTMFPTAHLIDLLKAARQGRNQVFRVMFDGFTLDGPIEVNAFVGSPLPDAPEPWSQDPLTNLPSWHMRLAFFPVKDSKAEPDYELGLRLFENGVADDFEIDYGSFVVNARLEKLEALPEPEC